MPDADDFTADPDARESDRTLGRVPLYQTLLQEPGRQKGKATSAVLGPCPRCGRPVVTAQYLDGSLVALEPSTQTYTLVWQKDERWPRLAQSRGYVAHQCARKDI